MSHITYNAQLIFDNKNDEAKIIEMLRAANLCWNECSKVRFNMKTNSIVELHRLFYKSFRDQYPNIPSQLVVQARRAVLSTYSAIKSKKEKIIAPPIKKKLSLQLDDKMFSYRNETFSLISLNKRVKCKIKNYTKLNLYLSKYKFQSPIIFCRNNKIYISLIFEIIVPQVPNNMAVGIDIGCKIHAATSNGNLYIDKKFNADKRKLRYLKRCLQSKIATKRSKKAKEHLNNIRRKEKNINRNFIHHLTKKIINDTTANTLVIENLKSIKVKKTKYKNNNRISQVPFYQFKTFLIYKAHLLGKQVITVCPAYTSQIDHRTNKKDGVRRGSRYIGKDGQLLHADVNAACNIAKKSKLPCSINNYFAWQAKVRTPIVNRKIDK